MQLMAEWNNESKTMKVTLPNSKSQNLVLQIHENALGDLCAVFIRQNSKSIIARYPLGDALCDSAKCVRRLLTAGFYVENGYEYDLREVLQGMLRDEQILRFDDTVNTEAFLLHQKAVAMLSSQAEKFAEGREDYDPKNHFGIVDHDILFLRGEHISEFAGRKNAHLKQSLASAGLLIPDPKDKSRKFNYRLGNHTFFAFRLRDEH